MNEVVQGTAEWFAIRAGKVTASRIADMVAKTRTGWGAGRKNYHAQLVAERLTGEVVEGYTNAAMQWGKDHEEDARIAYAFYCDVGVEQIGFVDHPRIAMSGCSPDGIVDGAGLVEIKCPTPATHIETLLDAAPGNQYSLQMQWQMACTETAWCDLVSFDPRMPEEMRLSVTRINRDADVIAELEKETIAFLSEVDATVAALRSRYLREAA